MILRPDRRIVTPRARPVRRGVAPLYGMADGDLHLLNDAGQVHLDAAGNRYLACCCEPSYYMQLRRCSDGANVDAWTPYDVIGGVPQVNVAGGWYALPTYWQKDGAKYYFAAGNPTSTTPGTSMGVGYAGTTSCATCSACVASSVASYRLTFTGISVCACASFEVFADYYKSHRVVGDPNGTYDLTLTGCAKSLSVPTSTVATQVYADGTPCATASGGLNPVNVEIAIGGVSAPYVRIRALFGYGAGDIFQADVPANTDCRRAFTLDNSITNGDCAYERPAYGGSVTVTPL